MAKTKVIEFITSLGDGGAETLVKDYALMLDREQFDVTVVVCQDRGDSANVRRLAGCGIKIIILTEKSLLFRLRDALRPRGKSTMEIESAVPAVEASKDAGFLSRVKQLTHNGFYGLALRRIIRSCQPDVIHGHLEVLRYLDFIRKDLKNIRLLHTCHALPELIYNGGEEEAARRLIRENHLQLIALHDPMAEQMNAMFGVTNTQVIRNGIDLHRFQNPAQSREETRKALGIPEDAFVAGHVGRFTPEKNHLFLTGVFGEMEKQRENCFFLMVGAGDTQVVREAMDGLGLEGKYRILPHRTDIPELLKAMDVFVFPSRFEGFGIALLEAQAAGLRCVASDRCPEAVFCSSRCLALPVEDPRALAVAACGKEVALGQRRDLNDYDMHREIRRLEDLYKGTNYA